MQIFNEYISYILFTACIFGFLFTAIFAVYSMPAHSIVSLIVTIASAIGGAHSFGNAFFSGKDFKDIPASTRRR